MVGINKNHSEDQFELTGEGKESLKISLDNIIYFKSDDNYVDIVTTVKEDEPKTLVFRARLKSIEEQLKTHSQFIRVHRSFIVNLRYASDLGRKDTIKVKSKDWKFEMPISKKYQKELMKIVV
jgi:two-component system LytT family response regulator